MKGEAMSSDATSEIVRADDELVELLEDFFAREVTPDLVDAAERTGELPTALWDRAEAVQIPWIGIAEDHGGVGGTFADVVALVHHAAYRGTPLPLLEHHLAATLLARAGLRHVDGPLTVAGISRHDDVPGTSGDTLSGRIPAVPWAGGVAAVVVLTRDERGNDVVALVRRDDVTVETSTDLAGTPVPTVVLDDAPVEVGQLDGGLEAFLRYAEVLRCSALAGLLRRLYDLTSRYVSERHQFGKPVGSFQAVQIHTVNLAQAATMSMLSVDRAAGAVAAGVGELEVAATSVVVGQNAVRAAAAAHQAHGAIGMTREYPLQQVTRRIHAIRQLWGSLTAAEEAVGLLALAAPRLSELVARHPEEGLQSA